MTRVFAIHIVPTNENDHSSQTSSVRKGINFRRPCANFPLKISRENLKKTTAALQNRRRKIETFIEIFAPPRNIVVKRKNSQILNVGR